MADIADLLVPLTVEEWDAKQLEWAVELELPTTTWRAQTPERVVITLNSRSLDVLGGIDVEAIRGGFLTYARGRWLTLLAEDTFETTRKLATFASCLVTFANVTATPYSIPSGDRLILKKTGTDITYRVDGPFTIPGNGSVAGLSAVAEVAGSAGTAVAGDITELQDALPGVTVTNTTTAVGTDEEQDETLRARARLATGPLSPAGPSAAYEYVATTALRLDGQPVDVIKVKVTENDDDGSVVAYFASASGASVDVGSNVAPAKGTVNYAIRKDVVPNGVKYSGFSATPLIYNLTYLALVRGSTLQDSGLDVATIKDRVETYVAAYFGSLDLPIEGFPLPIAAPPLVGFFPATDIADLIGEAVRVNSDIEAGNAGQKVLYGINVNSGDIQYLPGQVAVLGTVTANIVVIG